MKSEFKRRALGVSLLSLLLAACGSGGSVSFSFALNSVTPNVSATLLGGETVEVTGVNFLDVTIVTVMFGGHPVQGVSVLGDGVIEVVTPPAPNGATGSVDVTVITADAGARTLANGYTYQNGDAMAVGAITPTTFTATGAEDFTITGQNLAGAGQTTVEVIFGSAGTVVGNVSDGGATVTGRAPLVAGTPPAAPVTVTVRRAPGEEANAPQTVTFDWNPPFGVPGPGQTVGGASQPVRIADGYAVACTAGVDGTWGNLDDEVLLLSGHPAAPNSVPVRRIPTVPGPAPTPVGFLHPQLSIPVSFATGDVFVYSVGTGAGPRITRITNISTATPTVTDNAPPGMNPLPLAAIGPNRLAYTTAGPDGILNGAASDEDLYVIDVVTMTPFLPITIGHVDLTLPASFSLPRSADGGSTVFLVSTGADAVAGNGNDQMVRAVVPAATASFAAAPFLVQPPLVLSSTTAFAPGAGANGVPGNADDTVEVFFHNGATLARTPRALGAALFVGAPLHAVRLGGSGGVVAAGTGLQIFTDILLGSPTLTAIPGVPILAGLPSLEAIVFGPGADLVVGAPPDEARHISGGGASVPFADVPLWTQAASPGSDADRAFAVGRGPDGAFGTGDELLVVQSVRALGQTRDGTTIPLAVDAGRSILSSSRFVPLSGSSGIIQSPGPDGVFGTPDDHYVLTRH